MTNRDKIKSICVSKIKEIIDLKNNNQKSDYHQQFNDFRGGDMTIAFPIQTGIDNYLEIKMASAHINQSIKSDFESLSQDYQFMQCVGHGYSAYIECLSGVDVSTNTLVMDDVQCFILGIEDYSVLPMKKANKGVLNVHRLCHILLSVAQFGQDPKEVKIGLQVLWNQTLYNDIDFEGLTKMEKQVFDMMQLCDFDWNNRLQLNQKYQLF